MKQELLALKAALEDCFTIQVSAVEVWHQSGNENARVEDLYANGSIVTFMHPDESVSTSNLMQLIIEGHFYNFSLWHAESFSRRGDISQTAFAESKKRIDTLNEKRRTCIENADLCIIGLLAPIVSKIEESKGKYNTETAGMSLDRLSMLYINIFHLKEELERPEITPSHGIICEDRLSALKEQCHDLQSAILELVDDYGKGGKIPKFYPQIAGCSSLCIDPETCGL